MTHPPDKMGDIPTRPKGNKMTVHVSDELSEKGGVVLYLISEDGERTRVEVASDTLEGYLASLMKQGFRVS